MPKAPTRTRQLSADLAYVKRRAKALGIEVRIPESTYSPKAPPRWKIKGKPLSDILIEARRAGE